MRLAIFERIRAEGTVSRAAIAKVLGISPATVTTQTSTLLQAGLIREERMETDPADSPRGRPPIALAVEPGAHRVVGLKLSDKENSAVLFDFAGRQLASATRPSHDRVSPEDLIASTVRLIEDVCTEGRHDVQDLSAIGVGIPGFVNSTDSIVHWSPLFDGNCPNFAELLGARLGRQVIVDNDANMIALAELWFGAGRQISDFAVVTIEQGVGLGLVIGHKLYTGARGMGMELGHTKVAMDGALCRCGQRGCLEAYVADYAIVRDAGLAARDMDMSEPVPRILEALQAEAANGNVAAQSIFDRAVKYLALGMANVANLFDPELIVLSGERMQFPFLSSEALLSEIKRHALQSGAALPPVEVHAWGDHAWAAGAAAMALNHVTECELGAGQEP